MQQFKNFYFIFIFIYFLYFGYSQNALYDFGSMQQGKTFSAEPGEQLNLSLFFFVDKEYGNRITHVKLDISEKPNWDIYLIPPKHIELVNVSGVLVESEENIYVEPREVLPQKPEPGEEGITYIRSPSGKGYLQAKEVKIVVNVPKNAELGKIYPLVIRAEAFWFGREGNIALKQTRTFRFEIKTLKKEFSEEIVKQQQVNQSLTEKSPPLLELNESTLLILLVGVIILLILLWFFSRGKKQSQDQKKDKKKKKR
ncbi:MAG: hypothetical protein NC918_00290 [Candidatus Omnitrophica bacterium]|nr:hypothetical protein [Candidatus Omnitrophota bacterium]